MTLQWLTGVRSRQSVSVALTSLITMLALTTSPAVAAPKFSFSFGSPAPGPIYPLGVAMSHAPGHEGHLYVSDAMEARVIEYAPDGSVVNQFGGAGDGNGRFGSPTGVAVDSIGRVYVADGNRDVVQRFSADGQFQLVWGESGAAVGQLDAPAGLAVRELAGNKVQVYVADSGNDRVQRFSADGADALAIGVGVLLWPQAVALNPLADQIVVADSAHHRIQKFGADGLTLGGWGQEGSGVGDLKHPYGVAVDADQRVYVADTSNGRIQRFQWNGGPSAGWTGVASTGANLTSPVAVAVDSLQGVVVAADSFGEQVRRFDLGGAAAQDFPRRGFSPGEFRAPWGVAVDSKGRAYVVDRENHRIQRFPPGAMTPDRVWGSPGSGPGQFLFPYGVAVDSRDRVYVTEASGNRVQRFPAGMSKPDKIWGGPNASAATGQFDTPFGLAIDAHDRLYVADSDNHRIQRFPADSTQPDLFWPIKGDQPGEFSRPYAVAVDKQGRVFVADADNHRIQRFAPGATEPDKVWGSKGGGQSEFADAEGVAIDRDGRVLVADTFNHRIQRFTADGEFVDSIGGFGLWATTGVFDGVPGVAVNPLTGAIYATSLGTGRVNVYDYRPQPRCADGKDNDGDGRVDHPNDLGCTGPADDDESGPPPPANAEPDSDIVAPTGKVRRTRLRRLVARATDRDGQADLAKVRFALVRKLGHGRRTRCYQLKSARRFARVRVKHGACPRRWLVAKGTSRASLRLKRRLPVGGGYTVYSQASDRHGHAEHRFSRTDRNKLTFRVKR